MSFRGFFSGGVSESSESAKMVADNSFLSHPLQMVHSSVPQSMFNSPVPLSLTLQPKKENLGEMGLSGKRFDSRRREDGFENENFDDDASGDDQETLGNKSSKKKKYHRHTPFQIQELEAAFNENPHPDEKSRLDLGKKLGLENRQVKFWFQNRRTQIKTQLEHHDNSILKQENDKLLIENMGMKEAMQNPICNNCGGPAILGEIPVEHHHLMIDNARLKDELNRLDVLTHKFFGRPVNSMSPVMGTSQFDFSGGLNYMEPTLSMPLDFSSDFPIIPPNGHEMDMMNTNVVPFNKSVFLELGLAAMDELVKLTQPDTPLWVRILENSGEKLNLDEYRKMFPPCVGETPNNFTTEATRSTGKVMIDSETLVDTLMEVNRWTEMFPWIVGRASILDVISTGIDGKRNGALVLMEAEFQVLSALVPVRQVKFVRFCKQHTDGIWGVVDVSIDNIYQNVSSNILGNYRRLPSGCIVQDMGNGCSKVTWVEHNEYDETFIHLMYKPFVMSGMAFGAQKWLSSLQRQCEFMAGLISSTVPGGDQSALSPNVKKSLAKLAHRMTRNFCTGVCATVHKWDFIQSESSDDTKLIMRKSVVSSGEPAGVILCATTTIWIPVPPQHLFDFLRDEKMRVHWDVLSQDGPMQQIVHIPRSQDLGNGISILRASVLTPKSNQNGVLILQETCSDASGFLIVHAAVESAGMNIVMNGGDSSDVPFLPSGFAIFPDCIPNSGGHHNNCNGGGSLLTVGYQILVNNLPAAAKLTMESVETVKTLIAQTLDGIKSGIGF